MAAANDISTYRAELAAAFALRHCAWCGEPARSVVIGIPPAPDSNRCLGCLGEVVPGPWPMLRSLERPGRGAVAGKGGLQGKVDRPFLCQGMS